MSNIIQLVTAKKDKIKGVTPQLIYKAFEAIRTGTSEEVLESAMYLRSIMNASGVQFDSYVHDMVTAEFGFMDENPCELSRRNAEEVLRYVQDNFIGGFSSWEDKFILSIIKKQRANQYIKITEKQASVIVRIAVELETIHGGNHRQEDVDKIIKRRTRREERYNAQ